MDIGALNLFLKMIEDEYKLGGRELQKISRRLLADDSEFERVWSLYRRKASETRSGVDAFRPVLTELLQN